MNLNFVRLAVVSVASGTLLTPALVLAAQKPSPSKKANPLQPAAAALPAIPGASSVPIALPPAEQMPASPPQVSFKGGKLTIVARNSSLGAILQEVQSQTGANIDMPSPLADRVVGQFGPGPAREVLASLLNGSHFNYVLLGSPQNPNSLEKVVLLSKNAGSDQPGSQASSPVLPQRQGAFIPPTQESDDINSADNAEEMAEPEQPAEQQPEQNNTPANAQPAIKTPQQLLQELQRQQQAQQPGTPGSPPQNPMEK